MPSGSSEGCAEEGDKERVKGVITAVDVAEEFQLTKDARGGKRQVKQLPIPFPVRKGRAGISLRTPSPPTTLHTQEAEEREEEAEEEEREEVEHTLTLPPTSDRRVAGVTVREGGAVGSKARTFNVKVLERACVVVGVVVVVPHSPSLETPTAYTPGGMMWCAEEGMVQ